MKYRNANILLPKKLLSMIQEYVQGEYIYIPVKDKYERKSMTDYKTELMKRDAHIYTKHLEGMSHKLLAERYHLSESSIRRIIAKQRKGDTFMEDTIHRVLFHWGLQDNKIKQLYDTAWQVGDNYVLKVYQNSDMLERNLKILHILDEMHIPVGKMIPANDNAPYVICGNSFYFLSKRLSGSSIIRIDDARNTSLMMGEIIAKLHKAFKQCENMHIFWKNSLLDEMNGWVKRNFEDNSWNYINKEEYEKTVSRLADIYDDLPVQLIHRDVHFGNFLFADGKFSGYIDFDLSQINIRIFDICYFLLGLLSEEEKFDMTEEVWYEFVKNVFAGYENILKLSEAEKTAVPYVMECIELLFVSYFEGIHDRSCAENAYKIFEFVKKRENKIWKLIHSRIPDIAEVQPLRSPE